ncbi:hypothetical protein [Kitasatospora sp. NPDC088346]|uniref:hypothetical protein n=1 Tax=Kitasatospora sp. NPDC088346 TaxID=3364073 RepID=UPI0038277BAD
MKVRHLNCSTVHPPGARLVCHVLLVETPAGLVLVDSGHGLHDITDPAAASARPGISSGPRCAPPRPPPGRSNGSASAGTTYGTSC